ncbi:hypothetical protein [Bacillus sp. REN16]|uniref:hypothetical protein n=1 Tax=Bacillus sp. REN16 TaxID=2887296 RepID=UPI001E2A88BE|nr:hypothetical protein [Bacillus sp. REN16]MCC3357171.1 hypothetical protein [Bacillus sp. REN16]
MRKTIEVTDHGIPVQYDEARTAAFCTNKTGESRFIIAAKGFVVIVDPETSISKQVFFPEGYIEYPFASFSSNGLFFTGAGKLFMILDPFKEKFIFYKFIENGEEIVGFSFAEDVNNSIYFTTYPNCNLLTYCPKTNRITDYGSMDDTEKYPGSLAVDYKGWVYIGIGTERKNIIAFHPAKNIKKSIVTEELRTKGAGYVYQGQDNKVYGHWDAADLKNTQISNNWMVFLDGNMSLVETTEIFPGYYTGQGFQKIHRNHAGAFSVVEYSLSEKFVIFKTRNGTRKKVKVKYQSNGADLSVLYLGPDRTLYGTSMHPLHFFNYDFIKNEIYRFGPIEKGGGGNIAAYASHGQVMVGLAYAGGKLYEIDLRKKIQNGNVDRNPKLLYECEEIHRPRCALAHQDGVHIVWGGFPGYGLVGGGLGIYNVQTKENTIIPHTALVPNQSTFCLGQLKSGSILAGTSVETPGGAMSKEREACLYSINLENRQVEYMVKPLSGIQEISQLYIDEYDRAHCLTNESLYFVFDTETKDVIYTNDLSKYGRVVRNSFIYDSTHQILLCLLSDSIVKISIEANKSIMVNDARTLSIKATSGIVFYHNKIFFGSESHLCSMNIADLYKEDN